MIPKNKLAYFICFAVFCLFCLIGKSYAINNNNMVTDKKDPYELEGESRIGCTIGFCGLTVQGFGWSNRGSWLCSSDAVTFSEKRTCWRNKNGESFTVSITPDRKVRGMCNATDSSSSAPEGAQVGASSRECSRHSVHVNNDSEESKGGVFYISAPEINCGEWTQCNSTPFDPAPAICTPGDRQYQPCGECGTQYKECLSNGSAWGNWSFCPDFKQLDQVSGKPAVSL